MAPRSPPAHALVTTEAKNSANGMLEKTSSQYNHVSTHEAKKEVKAMKNGLNNLERVKDVLFCNGKMKGRPTPIVEGRQAAV